MTRSGRAAAKRSAPGLRFRQQIEAALADGLAPDGMALRLTLSDISHLKRDQTLAVADISFAGGLMRFLGVPVEPATGSESELVRSPSE